MSKESTKPLGFPAPEWGPWVGAPSDRYEDCAVLDCPKRGRPQVCLACGRYHHHGCIHYDRLGEQAGLEFSEGWGWLCEEHYIQLKPFASQRYKDWNP